MSISRNVYGNTILAFTLFVALVLIAGLFIDVKPVQAGACGHTFLDSYHCWGGCTYHPDLGFQGCPYGAYLCQRNLFHILANPYSEKYISGEVIGKCNSEPYTCPASCQ